MAKATHKGTCQCCGRVQMLPNGRLSKHGYTVDYGFFSGTCQGAGELPFEKSKDLIEGWIEAALEHAAKLRVEAVEYMNDRSMEGRMQRKYFSSSECGWREKAGYRWVKGNILHRKDEPEASGYVYEAFSWEGDKYHNVKHSLDDMLKPWVNHLLKQAEGAEKFAEWQKDRIKNWEEKPLLDL